MTYVYNIAGLNIFLDLPYTIKSMHRFEKFYSEDTPKEMDIYYNFIEVKNRKKFKTKPIYSCSEYNIFCEDNILYREFVYLDNKNPNACLIDKGDNNYTCYLYNKYNYEEIQYSNIFDSLALESTFIKQNVFILHSSFINYKGSAILFSGNSGIGKSTQANLWQKYKNIDIINGDRAFIRKVNNIWYAYGSPFSGSSKIYKNESYPINSIIMLKQAKENKVIPLDKKQAFRSIIRQGTINRWNSDFYNNVINLVDELTNDIPVYLLECLPNEDAVNLLEKYIKGNLKNECKDS